MPKDSRGLGAFGLHLKICQNDRVVPMSDVESRRYRVCVLKCAPIGHLRGPIIRLSALLPCYRHCLVGIILAPFVDTGCLG